MEELMRRAIGLTAGARPHPNPRVGVVLVGADGTILAEASHQGPGMPHAEVTALEQAGAAAAGATLVTTLEPCSHHGRTPPCTDALVAAAIGRVVVGAVDPDPRVSGAGVAILRAAGVAVDSGVLAAAVEAADPAYFHHRRTGRPLVTLKAALTLDGQSAAVDGSSQWITGEEARADAHLLRAEADAVVVGAGTLLADDPKLTVRVDSYDGPQPIAVVVAGRRPLPPEAAVFQRKALVYAPAPLDLPAEVVVLGEGDGVDLTAMLADLAERGALALLVEGGATLAASLLRQGLVDQAIIYLAGRIAGGHGRGMFAGAFDTLGAARPVSIDSVRRLGPDLRVTVGVG